MYIKKNLRKKHHIVTAVLVLLLLLCIVLVLPFLLSLEEETTIPPSISSTWENLQVNPLCVPVESATAPEKFSPRSQLDYHLNQVVTFPKGDGLGHVMIENPSYNQYALLVEWKNTQGEILYVSQHIPPGYRVEEDQLNMPLETGGYAITAVLYAIDPHTQAVVSQAEEKIQVIVK